MKIFKKLSLWLPVLSLAVCLINYSGNDDKNLLLFLTSPVLLWLNPQLTDMSYAMDNERLSYLILYAIHFSTWLLFGILFDWIVSRRRAK
ncbi:hypothetical protein [Paenibacillus sp. MMS20-IR301]|uniref:hypothetical protein n=1 Tax=Paenibacillus sp. MMS20-IR301 TaxID=2895946 RepID=UPI0028EE0382|nr:hypothetical protein [Paenibacillus sp. MMS20-IR301]WNS43874.1 hypothetical protein LOS79_01000 [Paenibacillus sp. MMS20-IR301]